MVLDLLEVEVVTSDHNTKVYGRKTSLQVIFYLRKVTENRVTEVTHMVYLALRYKVFDLGREDIHTSLRVNHMAEGKDKNYLYKIFMVTPNQEVILIL